MKKYLLCGMFSMMSLFASAQSGWFDNVSEAQNTGYYYFNLYNNTLFPDSTVKVLYGNGAGGLSLGYVFTNGAGEVFDPKSYMYNNPVSRKQPYVVDSVGLHYLYNYVPQAGAAPDTLIFQFYSGTGTLGSSNAIDTAYFTANNFPLALMKYDYQKNLGMNAVGQVKYILKQSDSSGTGRIISLATNGVKGIAINANELFAYTISYRPGFKYKTGDTIDEQLSPKPAHLHSHFRVLEGNSVTKDQPSDFEESETVINTIRHNIDPNWDGLYIPGTAWNAYNQILWSAFHIEIKKPVAILNDAGIHSIINPYGAECAGRQSVEVSLANFGHNILRSAKINWSVNDTLQTPYFWTGILDSGYTANVTISSSSGYNFSSGTPNIAAWTTLPNGVTDQVPANDSAQVLVGIYPLPVVNAGASSSICRGKSVTIGSSATGGGAMYYWSSDPTGFASTISNPTVSPNVTTVYTLTGTTYYGCRASDTVVITVNPLPNADWSVTNVSKYYDFKVKDSSQSPASYLWDFGDGSATTSGYQNIHVFPSDKPYQIKLTVVSGAGCIGELDSTIVISHTGIAAGQTENPTLNIYPNPATNLLNIVFTDQLNEPAAITITDQLGRVLSTKQIDGKSNAYQEDITGLSKGIYILNVQLQDQRGGKYMFVKE